MRLVQLTGDDGSCVELVVHQCLAGVRDSVNGGFCEWTLYLLESGRIALLKHRGRLAPPADSFEAFEVDSLAGALEQAPAAVRDVLRWNATRRLQKHVASQMDFLRREPHPQRRDRATHR